MACTIRNWLQSTTLKGIILQKINNKFYWSNTILYTDKIKKQTSKKILSEKKKHFKGTTFLKYACNELQ